MRCVATDNYQTFMYWDGKSTWIVAGIPDPDDYPAFNASFHYVEDEDILVPGEFL